MKATALTLAATVLCWTAPALAADRLTDKDVKSLVARIEQDRDRFDNALDGKLKNSILRGPSGEVKVADLLNEFQESIDRLEERMKPDYAASAEAGTLLRRAAAVHRLLREQLPGIGGESEWNRLETDLKALALAYGTDFPPPENATVRRIGDGELAAELDAIARTANQLKKSLDADLKKDTSIDKAARQAIVSEADGLSKDAKALRDRVKNGQPSSAEAERLLARAARMKSIIDGHRVPTSTAAWTEASTRIQAVARAYGASGSVR